MPIDLDAFKINVAGMAMAVNELNNVRDYFTTVVAGFETQINALNLGVESWVILDSKDGEWQRLVGYGRTIGNKWGLLLAERQFKENKETVWRYNDAPLWMRLDSVARFPTLLEKLTFDAQQLAQAAQRANVTLSAMLEGIAIAKSTPSAS